jgi:TM2 domain-containing membrane protein YozV
MTSPPRKYDYLAAFLTYLIPGLGQVKQGRIGKGILYFVCLYGLFFYGMYLGKFQNVWLAKADKLPRVTLPVVNTELSGLPKDLSYRKEFLAQFWIGAAAWPALFQYNATDPLPGDPTEDARWVGKEQPVLKHYMQAPSESQLNDLQRSTDTTWDLGWVLTVIAGVLNILVIYDALAGPLVKEDMNPDGTPKTPTPNGGQRPPTPPTAGGGK